MLCLTACESLCALAFSGFPFAEWTGLLSITSCLQGATRFSSSLTEAANSLHGGIELQKPEQQYVDSIELKAAAFSRAASDDAVLQHFNEVRSLVLSFDIVCCLGVSDLAVQHIVWAGNQAMMKL